MKACTPNVTSSSAVSLMSSTSTILKRLVFSVVQSH